MKEQGGRFFHSSQQGALRMTVDGLASEQTAIVVKSDGRFVPNEDLASTALREKATKIAVLLTQGKNAEAIFLASFVNWRVKKGAGETAFGSVSKAATIPWNPVTIRVDGRLPQHKFPIVRENRHVSFRSPWPTTPEATKWPKMQLMQLA